MPRMIRWLLRVLIFAVAPVAFAADVPQRPNVLFIISDDMNCHLGCYGDEVVKTPNIDKLAARGIRFERAYCQYPVCNPSRTSFLSGLHPETTKVCDQQTVLRKQNMPDVVYLPEHFKANGYFTAGIGKVEHGGHYDIKWDLLDDFKGAGGDDEDEGAAKRPATRPATPTGAGRRAARRAPATQNSDAEVARRLAGEGLPYTVERQTDEHDPENTDDRIADKVVKLLNERAKSDQPFFIAAGFHKPHVPHVAPKRFFDMYPLEKIKLAEVPAGDEKDIPPIALASKKNYQPDMPEQTKREIIRAYLACTSYLDEKIGQVMSALDDNHLWDNTIIVFIGDHGWNFGEHNWWAKASLFEESCRAPLIVVAPGGKSDTTCPRVIEYVDIYPTLADFCHLPAPHQGEGRSFVPLMHDPEHPWYKAAYTALHPGPLGRTVRDERYRYTEWDQGRKGAELYDHDTDPHELTNLAEDPAHAQVLEQMKHVLHSGPATQPSAAVSR